MDYEIRLAENCDGSVIIEMLNKVTLDLHEKNINQWTYPWDFEEIEIDIKSRNIYIITLDNLIVGTFSLRELKNNSFFDNMDPKSLYLYRIAILSEYHGKNIGIKAIEYSYEISRSAGKALYLDCWAGNVKLKNFYIKAGFDYLGDFPEEDYMVSVFRYK